MTCVVTVEVLLPWFGSGSLPVTVTVFEMLPVTLVVDGDDDGRRGDGPGGQTAKLDRERAVVVRDRALAAAGRNVLFSRGQRVREGHARSVGGAVVGRGEGIGQLAAGQDRVGRRPS